MAESRSKTGLFRAFSRFVLVHPVRKRDRIGKVVVEVTMISKLIFKRRALIAWVALVAISVMPFTALAQTQIKYHSNRFSVQDDVKLGRQAAQEAESQFPLLRDAMWRVSAAGWSQVFLPNFNTPNFSITSKS
jgi:hypothetical protein